MEHLVRILKNPLSVPPKLYPGGKYVHEISHRGRQEKFMHLLATRSGIYHVNLLKRATMYTNLDLI
jgi:hypothetical protein